MRDTIFNLIVGYLQTCTKFIGENGTVRVYDWAVISPDGYPYAVVGSESLESTVLDNASDTRRYNYSVQIVGEKFGEEGGVTQREALQAMRATEDAVLAIIDAHYFLGRDDIVIRTMPQRAEYGFTDNNARIVLTIHLSVDTRVIIGTN